MLRMPMEEDARALLDGAGIHYRDCGGYFLFKCPFHADKNPSAVLYKDNYAFKCFAGCGGMSWRKFYHKIRGVEWNENGSFSLSLRSLRSAMPITERQHFAITDGRVTSVYDNVRALEYCRSRGVSDEFMRHFDFRASDLCRFKADGSGRCAIWQGGAMC